MSVKKRCMLAICSISILFFSAMNINAQTKEVRDVVESVKICTSCGYEPGVIERYCTNCGASYVAKEIILSPGLSMYVSAFYDLLEKYDLKIKQKNRGWKGSSSQKILETKMSEFVRLLNLTRGYCDRKELGFIEIIASGMLYKGKDHFGLPDTVHYTEILY
jgi:hypothetical protein